MKRAIVVLCLVMLQGCAFYYARRLNTEQTENAVKLLNAYQGQGCLCADGDASPPGSRLEGTVIGAVGGPDVTVCAQICIKFRR